MGVIETIRKLLGLLEGHEDAVARQVSKRTSVSEQQVREGITQVREALDEHSSEGSQQNRS